MPWRSRRNNKICSGVSQCESVNIIVHQDLSITIKDKCIAKFIEHKVRHRKLYGEFCYM